VESIAIHLRLTDATIIESEEVVPGVILDFDESGHPAAIELFGNLLALFCSIRCPGAVILQAFELAIALRDTGISTIGGFQTPMEREMLAVLLRGKQRVVIIDARGERKRLPGTWQAGIAEKRLVVVSPFTGIKRPTIETARERNRLVVSAAKSLLVVYASPDGETERLALDALRKEKPVFALAVGDANERLFEAGATPLSPPWPDAVLSLGFDAP